MKRRTRSPRPAEWCWAAPWRRALRARTRPCGSTHTAGGGDRYTRRDDRYLSGTPVSVPFTTGQVQTLQIDGVVA